MTKLITSEELSKILRIPKRTIYKFAKEGQIPGVIRIGKHWRFRADEIEQWIHEQRKPRIDSDELPQAK